MLFSLYQASSCIAICSGLNLAIIDFVNIGRLYPSTLSFETKTIEHVSFLSLMAVAALIPAAPFPRIK